MSITSPLVALPAPMSRAAGFDSGWICGSGSNLPSDLIDLEQHSSRAASFSLIDPIIWFEPSSLEGLAEAAQLPRRWADLLAESVARNFLPGYRLICVSGDSFATNVPVPRFSTPTKMLDELSVAFSLNTVQLAEVALTTRQTIYNWRRGEKRPNPDARRRLEELVDLTQIWRKLSNLPVGDGLEHRDDMSRQSLLDLLKQTTLSSAAIERHLKRLDAHLRTFWAGSRAAGAKLDSRKLPPLPGHLEDYTMRDAAGYDLQT